METNQLTSGGVASSSGTPTLPCGSGKWCPPSPTPAPTTLPPPKSLEFSCTCQNERRVKQIGTTDNYECWVINYYPCCAEPDTTKKCGPSHYISVYNPCAGAYPYRRCNAWGSCYCSAYP